MNHMRKQNWNWMGLRFWLVLTIANRRHEHQEAWMSRAYLHAYFLPNICSLCLTLTSATTTGAKSLVYRWTRNDKTLCKMLHYYLWCTYSSLSDIISDSSTKAGRAVSFMHLHEEIYYAKVFTNVHKMLRLAFILLQSNLRVSCTLCPY